MTDALPRVLMVDDEVSIVQVFLRVFRRVFRPSGTASPAEALELSKETRFEIVFADYAMPGLNGLDLLKQIAEIQPTALRIMLTAHAEHPDIQEAARSGVVHAVLPKPWTRETIMGVVETARKRAAAAS